MPHIIIVIIIYYDPRVLIAYTFPLILIYSFKIYLSEWEIVGLPYPYNVYVRD